MAMSRKPGSPGQGKHVRRWTYNPVVGGSQWRGFLAGEPFGVFVHYVNRQSKPCKQEMTDKALSCEHCAKGLVPDWRGYTPYYDDSYTERFVLITAPYYESVLEIEHLAQIVIRRGKLKTDAVVIKDEAWRTTPIPHKAERGAKVDLSDFLIHVIWKDDELMQWDKREKAKAREAESKPYVAPEYQDKGAAAMHRLMRHEEKLLEATELAGSLAEKVIRDATTPKPNGKPFKPRV